MSEQSTQETTDNDGQSVEVLHEWIEQHDLYSRERYRMVRTEGGKMIYRKRETKENGEWVSDSGEVPIPDDAPEEKIPDHILHGWEDVPTEFKEIESDADW